MELVVKPYDELTLDELYEILRLRVSVFVVEQNCPYTEIDGRDKGAVHVYFRDDEGIQAYLRVLDKDETHPYPALGRVISMKRRCGLGTKLLAEGIRIAREKFGAGQIYLEAQTYAKPFYENMGFRQVSEVFPEDGIPHIDMLLDIENDNN